MSSGMCDGLGSLGDLLYLTLTVKVHLILGTVPVEGSRDRSHGRGQALRDALLARNWVRQPYQPYV